MSPGDKRRPRANTLDGREWLRHSISVWNDLRKSSAEAALEHPALFPTALVERLLDCFVREGDRSVLDPFAGSGSTLLAACDRGLQATGVELSPNYVALARERLDAAGYQEGADYALLRADARRVGELLPPGSVDFCVTSPPYWDILRQRRSADGKQGRHYGDREANLGEIDNYTAFLEALRPVFKGLWRALRPGAYCCVVVMDLRKGARFFPLHQDVAGLMQEAGFTYDDLIIWDRRAEYNNLRPLGYPYKFRINKVHEFILIFEKIVPDGVG
jgi:DNA modification methylase